MKNRGSFRWHFVLFVVLSLVAIAQLSWWVIFQVREGARISDNQRLIWNQQMELVLRRLDSPEGQNPAQFREWLNNTFPDLALSDDGRSLTITEQAENRLDGLARKRVRMFVSEGAFFSLLVLSGVWFLYWTLRRKVEMENQTAGIISAASTGIKNPISALGEDILALSGTNLSESGRDELLSRMKSNIGAISETCDRMSMLRLLSASRRKTPLSLNNLSEAAGALFAEIDGTLKTSGFKLESSVEPGLSSVTNLERWLAAVRGLMQIAMRITGEKIIKADFSRIENKAVLRISRRGVFESSGDHEFDSAYMLFAPEFNMIKETGEMTGAEISLARTDDGRGLIFTAVVPLLEDLSGAK